MQSLQPGDLEHVGQYRLLARLGAGGMGVVYLARSPGARLAALKLIRREFAADGDFRERFRREIAAARRVSGLYTAPVLDSDVDAPQPWFAAGYVPAPALDEALAALGVMPEPAVRALGAGLTEALQAIHGAGLVHRDLKPGNILLAEDGPKIIDFGIAKVTDATQLTGTGDMVGTLAYMAPEQIAGGGHAGPAADVFSLAGVLVYAATGAKPFGERDSTALLYEVMYGEPRLDEVPESLRGLLAACLRKEPARRPGLATVLAALTPADPRALISPALRREVAARETEANRVSSEPVVAPPPLPRIDDTDAGAPGRRRVLGLVAAVAVAGIGAGTTAWSLTRGNSKAAKPAPRGTALATAPPPAWTFTPPKPFSTSTSLLVAGGVVLWGGDDGTYGVDAGSGRRRWAPDIALASSDAVHGSTLITDGEGKDDEDRSLILIDVPTGRTTKFPMPHGTLLLSVFGVAGDTLLLETESTSDDSVDPTVWAVDLASGKILWRRPISDVDVCGAVDGTSLYLNSKPTLIALDAATGRERWVYTWLKGGGTRNWETLDIAVAGGKVFANFADTLQAIDTTDGTPVWSQHTDEVFSTVLPAGANVIFRNEVLRAYDQATGAARWSLAAPETLSSWSGHSAVSGSLLVAAFDGSTGSAHGIFAARTDGRALWAHWGPASRGDDWEVAMSGSSVFATDHRRLYCFRAGS
ncbi:PQQ-binding-like beta-propeller repeat protein [Actinoallomurus spadix]|uniref:Protein kinase domain-containing protein n=1 Tax=Actinoallomurus spadix TaxID=79912 RepID=A0ABN0W073_9ACTN|nr:serine/threonine-protein kinase [Actinoallomurus spadix]MCO5988176.1 PQQ-binding-like beta-propeller repeat protein [Actinoallomurus spadix]